MSLSKSEQIFWHRLRDNMKGQWLVTRHENGGTSPGTPDLHYGFLPDERGRYQTGWLELKAINGPLSSRNTIKVEPSQHQYYRRWAKAIPIHFLIVIDAEVLLVSSEYHMKIPKAEHMEEIRGVALVCFNIWTDIGALLPSVLRDITRIK